MTAPASHTLAYLRRLDEKSDRLDQKFDRLGSGVGDLRAEMTARLGRIEEELLVLNGIVLRLEGREVETTGSRPCSTGTSARSPT